MASDTQEVLVQRPEVSAPVVMPIPPVLITSLATEVPAHSSFGGSLMHLNAGPVIVAGYTDDEPEDDSERIEAHGSGFSQPLLLRMGSSRSFRSQSSRHVTPRHSLSGAEAAGWTGVRVEEPEAEEQSAWPSRIGSRFLDSRSALFGGLNMVITIPVMIAFCKVIFKEPEFLPYQGKLVRLVFLSAAIHQLVFTVRSNVPGSVGQVQDVGLIFLSAIATAVVERGRDAGDSFADTLATTLLLLTLTTLLVGVLVVVIARLKVASMVQYVPVPVVGGYLAFVGYFICLSGIEIGTGVNLKDPLQFLKLLQIDTLLRLLPMVAAWQVFHHTVQRFSSPLALPVAIMSIVGSFYLVLLLSGHSIADAQRTGWLPLPDEPMSEFWKIWELFQVQGWPSNIDWGAFLPQLPQVFALFIVVAFGSCMDIAAIQAQHNKELDFNNELELIGFSNAVVGLAGVGFTGSYIFSQTLFNMKFAADGPLVGTMIVLGETAMVMLPSSPVQYFPNFFFGGLMLWIGIDIMYDWLVASWGKLRRVEYAIIWLTLLTVMAYGLEGGILIGIIGAMAVFAFEYSKLSVTCFNVAASRSSYMRTFQQRLVLDRLSSNMVAISLSGYIFFGSATSISEKAMLIAELLLNQHPAAPAPPGASNPVENEIDAKIQQAKALGPKTLILDFRKVSGFDATAAQSFNVLRKRLEKQGVEMMITHINPSRSYIMELLRAHGVVGGQICHARDVPSADSHACLVFDSLNNGLRYCEERLLEVAVRCGACAEMTDNMPLGAVLRANRSIFWKQTPLLPVAMVEDMERVALEMLPFLDEVEFLRPNQQVFTRGDQPTEMYILQSGIISCEVDFTYTKSVGHESSLLLQTMGVGPRNIDGQGRSEPNAPQGPGVWDWFAKSPPQTDSRTPEQMGMVNLVEYGPGGILGDLDFFLQRPRCFSAKVMVAPCRVWRISHANLLRMADEAPQCLLVLQMIILRASSLSSSHAVEALEMASL